GRHAEYVLDVGVLEAERDARAGAARLAAERVGRQRVRQRGEVRGRRWGRLEGHGRRWGRLEGHGQRWGRLEGRGRLRLGGSLGAGPRGWRGGGGLGGGR